MRPKWSVIVCAYNQLTFSSQAIDRVLRYSPLERMELILVDDASKDGTYEFFEALSSRHPFIKATHHLKQQGYVKSANDGLKMAKGEYLVCCNNDVLVTPSWLQRLTYCVDQKLPMGEFGLVGPATNFSAGRQQVPNARYDFDKLDEFAKQFADMNHGNWQEVGALKGFCFMIKREVYEALGGFDERFSPGGFDDDAYCLDARAKGWKSVVAGDTFVHHFGSKTFDLPECAKYKRGVSFENQEKFLAKYVTSKEKMIVVYRIKNSAKWLAKSLQASSRFADEILVLDDDSTDKTVEIAKTFPKVKIKTQKKPMNEKRDREFLYNWAVEEGATWIASCDGDEIFDERLTKDYAKELMHPKNPMIKGYICRIITFWRGRKNVRVDGTFNNLAFTRIYKVEPKQHFVSPHSQGLHCSSAPEMPIENLAWCPVRILHYGYETFKEAKRKYEFYERVDQDKRPELIGGEDYSHLIDETNLKLREFVPKNSLALVTMVHNEEDFLWQFLDRIYAIFDEMVFAVDSRTTDKTREIIKRYGGKCFDFEFNDSFADMRNAAIAQCTTDWILQLDPDEKVPLLNRLLWYIDAEKADAFIFAVQNFQKGGKVTFSEAYRLFKRQPKIYYVGRVHETTEVSLGKMKATVKRSDVQIQHLGYLKEDEKVDDKLKLYEKLNKLQMQDDPADARPYFNLALHYINDGNRAKGIELLEKARELDPKYYLPRKELSLNYLRMAKSELGTVMKILPEHHPMFLQTKDLLQQVNLIAEESPVVGGQKEPEKAGPEVA